jgi:hypothetical protein
MEPWPQATRIESGFLRWWSTYACVARDDLSTEALLRVRHELDGTRAHSLDAAPLQPALQVSQVWAHRTPIADPHVSSVGATIIGTDSLRRGREGTGTGAEVRIALPKNSV